MHGRRLVTLGLAAFALAGLAVHGGTTLLASHSWGAYHWARTAASFDLTVVNSTTDDWDPFVTAAVGDWSQSTVLNMVEAADSTDTRTRRQCKAPAGMVRICNLAYGFNGWLGIAGISIDVEGHIVSGYTKLNDSYFAGAFYNTPYWKQSVACQELGHNAGLGHQDEDFNNDPLFTCMDYQDPPTTSPNFHDYEQLGLIYGHLDAYDSYATGGGGGGGGDVCNAPPGKGCNKAGADPGNDPGSWGLSLGRRGAQETFIRIDPDGTRHVTFVTWAEN